MALYDEKHAEFLSILEAQRFTERGVWEASFKSWLAAKIASIEENNRNISGNLLQPYLAAMRYSSKEAMDLIIAIGFNPTYQLLQKRLSILASYLSSSDNIDSDIVKYHLEQVSNFYSDLPEKQRARKLFDYINQVDPFLGQDALINVCTRKSKDLDQSSHITERSIIECVKVLLSNGADLGRSDRNNYTALQWAIIEGNTRVAINLIRNSNMDVCIGYNNSGDTPLSLSAKHGHRDVSLLLLKKGISANGYTTKFEHAEIPESMANKLMVNNPLLLALRAGHIGIANDLVLCGGDYASSINAHDMHTALIYAAKIEAPDALESMLKKGFNPNEANSHGFTPLLYLVSNLSRASSEVATHAMIRSLIKYGANIDVMSKSGLSSLDLLEDLAKKGDEFCMQVMFDRNVEKLKEFVSISSGVKVNNILDLRVNDEQLADMKLSRVENVSSIWLNRNSKTEEYKSSLSASGEKSFKEMTCAPFIGGSAVYGILKGIGEYAEKNSDIPYHNLVSMAVNNIGTITAICSVLSAGIVAYKTLTDDTKKYALGYWLKNTSKGIVEKYLDPIIKSIEYATDERLVKLHIVLNRVKDKAALVISRVSSAYAVLTGQISIGEKDNKPSEILDTTNVLKLPKNESNNYNDRIGLG